MNRQSVPPLLIALLSISALGIASTTLDTTLTTEPDDEINPNWDRLPIGQGDAAIIQEEIRGDEREETEQEQTEQEQETADEASEFNLDRVGQSGEHDERDEGFGAGTGAAGGSEQTLYDRLLALLAMLLRTLIPLLGMLAVGALLYRYREMLLSLLSTDTAEEPETDAETGRWPTVEPSHIVDQAWVTLVQRVSPEHPETMTTAECRALARERGFDATAVDAITTAFERVHYGGGSVSEEADLARAGLRQLEGESE